MDARGKLGSTVMIYRLADFLDGTAINVRYFADRDRALHEAEKLARVYEAMHEVTLTRHDVNQYGIIAVWTNKWPEPNMEIRLEEGELEA